MLRKALRKRSLFDRIGAEVDVVRSVLLLTGAIHHTTHSVDTFVSGWFKYSWLWTLDAADEFQVRCVVCVCVCVRVPLSPRFTIHVHPEIPCGESTS